MKVQTLDNFVKTVRVVSDEIDDTNKIDADYTVCNYKCIPAQIINYLAESQVENILMMILDCNFHILSITRVAKGCMTNAVFSLTEMLKVALLTNHAYSVIILHNHTSVDAPIPSQHDSHGAIDIANAFHAIGMNMSDFIIVNANKEVFSFMKERVKPFDNMQKGQAQ